MKIAFVLSGLAAGGAEKIVNLLAHHRLHQGDTVCVLAVNASDRRSYFPYAPAIAVEVLGETRSGSLGAAAKLLRLRRKLRTFDPDLAISFLTKVNTLTGLAALGLPARFVMSERNNFLAQEKNAFWRLVGPMAARRAACLVMQTEAARAALPAGLRADAVVIPNPVSLPRSMAPAPVGPPRIVAAGRLERQKGFDLLLEAFRRIADDMPAVTLTIFGEGPERAALERQVRALELAGRVDLPGVTPSPSAWTRPGDIFVLSSRFEGFPNVLLEALAAGMPAVAFDCPWGPAEILKDGAGLLVPAADADGLGDALRRLVVDAELRNRLAGAGRAAVSGYGESAVLAQWDAVILRATRPRPVSPAAPPGHTEHRYRTGS